MDGSELRALQAPLKERYGADPDAAVVTLAAAGELDSQAVTCKVSTGRGLVEAGLHPSAGGDGLAACSGDMLLEALVACAGVTLRAVATSMNLPVHGGTVRAEGDLDFRGTLGVSRQAPVGFRDIRLSFDLDADLTEQQRAKLIELTERYCVIYQTLRTPPSVSVSWRTVTLEPGQEVSVSVRSLQATSLECTITVDGAQLAEQESDRAGTATCQARL